MTARTRTVVAMAGLTLLGPFAAVLPVPAPPAGAASDGPVEEAREAARSVPFTARVEVRWAVGDELHTAEVNLRAVGGSIRVRAPQTAGDAEEAIVVPVSAVAPETTAEAGGLLTPGVDKKYDVTKTGSPLVAGRQTDQYELRSGGRLRERLAIDRETGLVLRREVIGSQGKPVRLVNVLQLDTAPVPEPADSGSGDVDPPESVKIGKLPSAYRGAEALAGGYQRVGAYRHDEIVHLLYTDGLHGMSLFSQPGRLRGGVLPPGGEAVRVGTSPGVHYTWAGGDVVTWQVGNVVHTLIGDGTAEDLLAAARSLPPPARPSLLERLRSTSRLVGELISGGR